MKPHALLSTAAALCALGVAAGAFGAHALRDLVSESRLQTWETAVRYHLVHAVALLVLAEIRQRSDSRRLLWAGRLLLTGMALFSGSLFLLVLTDTAWLGAVTPFGGASLIAGWLTLAVDAFARRGASAQRLDS